MVSILLNAKLDESDSNPQTLIDIQTRGGLCKTTEDCQSIFIRAEEKFKTETAGPHLRKIDFEKMTEEIMGNSDVVDFYKNILLKSEVNVDKEVSDNL